MLHLNVQRLFRVSSLVALVGCYGEGESRSAYFGHGETRKYLTIEHCEDEAISRYGNGSARYDGFECRDQIFGLTASIRRYTNGDLVQETRPIVWRDCTLTPSDITEIVDSLEARAADSLQTAGAGQ